MAAEDKPDYGEDLLGEVLDVGLVDEPTDPMEAYVAGLLAGMLSRHDHVHALAPLMDDDGLVTGVLIFGLGSASFVVEVRRTD